MNPKLFILCVFVVNLSATWAQLAIGGRARLIGGGGYSGNGLIGSRAVIGGTPIGAVYGNGLGYGIGGGVGYGGLGYGLAGVGVNKVAVGGLGYGLGYAGGLAGLSQGYSAYSGPVSAAVYTVRTHQVIDVPTPQDVIQPSTLVIEPNLMPVNIEFRSQSSPVNVNQVHIPGRPGIVERTSSEEEPDKLIHEVVKPVIQEVRETIVPFRKITQEILPVQEEVHSLVARGQRQQVVAEPQVARVAVAQPVGVAVAQPVGGLITTGINRFVGGGLVNGGLVNGGYIGGGLVNGGLIGGGLVRGGYGGGGLVNGGLIGGGVVSRGGLPGNLEYIKARS